MLSLPECQAALRGAILADKARSAPGAGSEAGLAVYRNAYRARLAGALRTNYPVLAELLGEEGFRALADDYARATPSRHYSIRWHGADLPRHLGNGADADLARMEWALGAAFDAADARPLDAAFLRTIPELEWAGVPIALHPSVSVLRMSWAVERQWEAIRAGGPASAAEPDEHALVVWRMSLQSHWRIADPGEGAALLALGASGTIERACEAADESFARQLGAWFARWVVDGLLTTREGSSA